MRSFVVKSILFLVTNHPLVGEYTENTVIKELLVILLR